MIGWIIIPRMVGGYLSDLVTVIVENECVFFKMMNEGNKRVSCEEIEIKRCEGRRGDEM